MKNSPSARVVVPRPSPQTSKSDSAVALVLTLLIVAMLTVVVVGFTTVSRIEQSAARNMTHLASAEQLAQLATSRAMQRLLDAMQAAAAAPMFSTQPGQINPFGAAAEPLYSSGTATTNVNRFTTNGLVTGNPSDNVTVGVETINDSAGNPLGRIAFYIDDESTKIAVNQATGASNNRTLNPQWPRPFAIQGADGVNAVRAANFNGVLTYAANTPTSISNWVYFFTPEQLRGPLTAEPLQQLTVATETNPTAVNTTPWGTQKVRINQISVSEQGVQELAQALSDPNLTEVFGQTLADKYTPEGLNQLAANMLQLRTDHWRGGVTFSGVDPILGGSQITGGLIAPPVGALKKTNGIPEEYYGYTPFPMLTEMDVSFVFGWQNPSPDDSVTVKVILTCVLTNPFPLNFPGGGELYAQIDKASFRLFYPNDPGAANDWRGPDGSIRSAAAPHNDLDFDNPWGAAQQVTSWNLDPANGVRTLALPEIGPNATGEVSVSFEMSFQDTNPLVQISESYIIIDQVKLLAEEGNAQSVRDWCSGNDFFNALSEGPQGPAQFAISNLLSQPALSQPSSPFGARGPLPTTGPPPPEKLVRLDPRLKPALTNSAIYQQNPPRRAWDYVPFPSPAPGPANFAGDPIPPDPGDAQSVIYNTNLPPILSTSDSAYAMAADLGKVFTGFPWRTLRMQPQPALESSAGLIPDWVLLDAVSFGDGTRALNSANPNSQIISLTAPVTRRTAAIRSQLDVLTNAAASLSLRSVAHPVLLGPVISTLPFSEEAALNFSRIVRGDASFLAQIASNVQRPDLPPSWSANSTWPARRAALGFPANALLLPSEMAEIRGMADFLASTGAAVNSNKFNEYRLNTLFPGAGSRSRFFRVYALGEALEGRAANAPVAAKAFLQTLVEVDISSTPPSIRIVNQYPPAE